MEATTTAARMEAVAILRVGSWKDDSPLNIEH
jgi:hypothetical protein